MQRASAATRLVLSKHRWGLLVAVSLITASAGCSNGNPAPTASSNLCRVDATHVCNGISGCRGVETCQADGSWTTCDCKNDPNVPLLGGPCSDDTKCHGGAFCLLPSSTTWLGGGPPQGLCVADCSTDVALCKSYSGAVCVSSLRSQTETPKHALCMPACQLILGTKTAFACSSVPSSACEALDNGQDAEGYCRPFCTFDSDCPSGHCDRQFGVCVAEALPAGLAGFGAGCTTTTECDGTCLHLGPDGAGVCTNRCVYGFAKSDGSDILECGIEGAAKYAGVCLYATGTATHGNLAYCTPLCNCNDDCGAPGYVCQAFSTETDAGTSTALGHAGMCVPDTGANGVVCEG